MTVISTLFQHTQLQSRTRETRDEIGRLTVELSSGTHADYHAGLGAQATRDMALRNGFSRLEAYREAGNLAASYLDVQQGSIGAIGQVAGALQNSLLALSSQGNDPTPAGLLEETARHGLAQVKQALNQTVGGRFVFSGTATGTPPIGDMADADAALDAIKARHDLKTMAGMRDFLAEVETAYAGIFDDHVYAGSRSGTWSMALDTDNEVSLDLPANDPAFRQVVQVMHVLSRVSASEGSQESYALLTRTLGEHLQQGSSDVLGLSGRVGSREQHVGRTLDRHEETSGMINNLIAGLESVDDYEVATRLMQLQSQLEMSYMLTSRLQRLSLVNYL